MRSPALAIAWEFGQRLCSSLEWTWFEGHTWQSQACAFCSAFMGWLYRRRDHGFHGLVLDALIEIDQN